ncbi:DUF4870 family protein [Thiohalomonas denitrificans]|uniref:DUF4870 family protein n=1 Tax=Thiohalomonas denitrificans TaxID=415747 RepID=UPI000AABD7D3|nr:hypothetical protein [Thiohalomonas denitrificans]
MESTAAHTQSLKKLLTAVYALQALSFLFPVTFIVGVVLDYVKRGEATDAWLASHFRWQIRTFWFTVLWSLLGGLTAGFGVGLLILFATAVWLIYRIAKGWLNLSDGKAV